MQGLPCPPLPPAGWGSILTHTGVMMMVMVNVMLVIMQALPVLVVHNDAPSRPGQPGFWSWGMGTQCLLMRRLWATCAMDGEVEIGDVAIMGWPELRSNAWWWHWRGLCGWMAGALGLQGQCLGEMGLEPGGGRG